MNEISTITADWSEDEQRFVEVFVKIVTLKHKEYEREHTELEASPVPLADITVRPDDFKEVFYIIQGIDRHRDWEVTVQV